MASAGYAGYSSITGSDVYYELAQPRQPPTYHMVSEGDPVGTTTRVTVLERRGHANWWRVWVNRHPISPRIYLQASHDRWKPMAAATSWAWRTDSTCSASRA